MPEPMLVVIFLRGGADGLSLVAPTGNAEYVAARPSGLRVERKGDASGKQLTNPIADADFRFHPQAALLAELYKAGELAVVHSAGLMNATRSHFDAEDKMERAAPGGASDGGWIGRWLKSQSFAGIIPALAVGAAAPESLRGATDVAVAEELNRLRLAPGHGYSTQLRAVAGSRFAADPILAAPVQRLLSLSDALEAKIAIDDSGALKPYIPKVEYPKNNALGQSLMTVAQTIKLGLGLRVSTVDYTGWDTHANQLRDFPILVEGLGSALMAFWRDLGKLKEDVTVVIMSEFGRRLKANESGGTDHGHGNLMMVLGPEVKGGRMYGKWPGLTNDALDKGADLAITTDYRHILAEVMTRHMLQTDTSVLFPDFSPEPLGFLSA